jgi:ribosomal protein S12 methylthiotransferase
LGLRDGLAQLLAKLAEIDELLWVRFLYAYPNRVTQKLLDTLAAHPRLAKYFDMPLQHASRNVLARMKRGSHGDAFLTMLERIRKTIPGVALRTSFVVGFPGETKQDFEELYQFVSAAKFDWMGVFEYSDVDNAASYPLDGKVDAQTIEERRGRLMTLQRKISREKLRAFKGRTEVALVEGPSKDSPLVWEARLEGMAPDIDGKLYLTDIELPSGLVAATGDMVKVEITKTDAYDLIGRVAEILPRPATRPLKATPVTLPVEQLTRISTGAALRVIG